jgi:hypothetical protein
VWTNRWDAALPLGKTLGSGSFGARQKSNCEIRLCFESFSETGNHLPGDLPGIVILMRVGYDETREDDSMGLAVFVIDKPLFDSKNWWGQASAARVEQDFNIDFDDQRSLAVIARVYVISSWWALVPGFDADRNQGRI